MRGFWGLSAIFAGMTASVAVSAACSDSASDDSTLVEYPPAQGEGSNDPSSEDPSHPKTPPIGTPDADTPPQPIVGKKVADGSVFIRGATTDGALVYDFKNDVMIWPSGAAAPLRLVQDYDSGTDSMIVKGRFVSAWLGEDIHPSSPTFWANTGGVQVIAPKIQRDTLYVKANADDFAYLAPAATSDILHRDVWATTAGGGAGNKVATALDMGLTNASCKPTLAYSASDLIIGGCVNDTTAMKVVAYATDGSGSSKVILDNAAPGFVINRARSHVIVQTGAASSVRPLSGVGSPVPIDGPFRAAQFSSDDTKVVYLMADGKIKRASTKAPASPTQLMTGAITVLGMSLDARFVAAATKGTPSQNQSDVVVADANAPAGSSPRVLVTGSKGGLVGFSKSSIIYLDDPGTAFDPPLYLVDLAAPAAGTAAPIKLSSEASRVRFANDVVYWQEFNSASKTNTLKAVRVSAPTNVITIDSNLDSLTTDTVVAGTKLFVGSKLGLWEYAAIAP